MPVVEWDSYIVQRRDLIQHLIGHIDIDADLATWQPLMSSSQWCGTAGTQQHIIIKMEGVPRQNMSGQRSYRLCHRGGHQGAQSMLSEWPSRSCRQTSLKLCNVYSCCPCS